ncbi:MAG: PDGLE domain-containing protein [Nocardioides sp.]
MTPPSGRPSSRALVLAGMVVALLLAGIASYYASSRPDGLESVATQTGFSDRERDSATSGSPLAGYQTRGVDNARLSGGIAGVAGTGAVLLLGGGLFWLLRRRKPTDRPPPGVASRAERAVDRRTPGSGA